MDFLSSDLNHSDESVSDDYMESSTPLVSISSSSIPSSDMLHIILIILLIIGVISVVIAFVCALHSLINYYLPEAPKLAHYLEDPEVVVEKKDSPKHLHILKVKSVPTVQSSKRVSSESGFPVRDLKNVNWNENIPLNSKTSVGSIQSSHSSGTDSKVKLLYKNDSQESEESLNLLKTKTAQKSITNSKDMSKPKSKSESKPSPSKKSNNPWIQKSKTKTKDTTEE